MTWPPEPSVRRAIIACHEANVLRDPVVAECRDMARRFASSGIAALCDVLPAERLTEFARESLAPAA